MGRASRAKGAKKTLIKLDIACGARKAEGHVGIDIAKVPGVDIVHDLFRFPWPVKSESVESAVCSHFFEHVPGRLRFAFMDEVARILIPEGKITIVCPYWSSMRAVQDPTHEWPPICEASFLYFNREWRELNKLGHYGVSCDFDFGYSYSHTLGGRSEEYVRAAIMQQVNAVADITVTLTKRPEKK